MNEWIEVISLQADLLGSVVCRESLLASGPKPSVPPNTLPYTCTVGQQIVLMFDRSLWKLSLALYGRLARCWGCDIIFWIFTPVLAPRKQKQEKTWPPRTAVCPTHSLVHTHILPLRSTALLNQSHAQKVNIQYLVLYWLLGLNIAWAAFSWFDRSWWSLWCLG